VQGRFISLAELAGFRHQVPFCPDGLDVWDRYLKTLVSTSSGS
jgi:hypothetical protein